MNKKNLFLLIIIIFIGLFLIAATGLKKEKKENSIEFFEYDKKLSRPFSEAVRVGNILILSGQIGIDPSTGKLAPGGIKAEAAQTLKNIKSTLKKHGLSMNNVFKCTVMLADINEWGDFNSVYIEFFSGRKPARSAFGASGLAMNSRVEVECWAYIPD